jgi:hypothetical protein
MNLRHGGVAFLAATLGSDYVLDSRETDASYNATSAIWRVKASANGKTRFDCGSRI